MVTDFDLTHEEIWVTIFIKKSISFKLCLMVAILDLVLFIKTNYFLVYQPILNCFIFLMFFYINYLVIVFLFNFNCYYWLVFMHYFFSNFNNFHLANFILFNVHYQNYVFINLFFNHLILTSFLKFHLHLINPIHYFYLNYFIHYF